MRSGRDYYRAVFSKYFLEKSREISWKSLGRVLENTTWKSIGKYCLEEYLWNTVCSKVEEVGVGGN